MNESIMYEYFGNFCQNSDKILKHRAENLHNSRDNVSELNFSKLIKTNGLQLTK